MPLEGLPKITVILVVLNEEKHIRLALESVLAQTFSTKSIELIVVDGGSSDNTLSIINTFFEKNKDNFYKSFLLHNPKKILATGWNIGVEASTAPYVLRFDGHSQIDKYYIQEGINAFSEVGETAVAVGGWLHHEGDGVLGSCISAFYTSPFGGGSAAFRRKPKEVLESDTALFAIYKKKALLDAGLFNEQQARNQDIELHKRLNKQGYKFFTVPGMEVTYHVRSSMKLLMTKAYNDGFWVGCSDGKLFRHLAPFFFLLYLLMGSIAAFIDSSGIVLTLFLLSLGMYFLIIYVDLLKRGGLTMTQRILNLGIFFSYHFQYGLGTAKGLLKPSGKKYE